jgi:NAD(P)-dependent dehydrogenase (short-subunit alcohol dehydrogenase family)
VTLTAVEVSTVAGTERHSAGASSVTRVFASDGLYVHPDSSCGETAPEATAFHITRPLSFELAPDVRVNALAPGHVKTKLAAALWLGGAEERIAAHIPLRRLRLPDDIATAALGDPWPRTGFADREHASNSTSVMPGIQVKA